MILYPPTGTGNRSRATIILTGSTAFRTTRRGVMADSGIGGFVSAVITSLRRAASRNCS